MAPAAPLTFIPVSHHNGWTVLAQLPSSRYQIERTEVSADATVCCWDSFIGDVSILQSGGHLEQTAGVGTKYTGRSQNLTAALLSQRWYTSSGRQHLWTEWLYPPTAYSNFPPQRVLLLASFGNSFALLWWAVEDEAEEWRRACSSHSWLHSNCIPSVTTKPYNCICIYNH